MNVSRKGERKRGGEVESRGKKVVFKCLKNC